MTWSLPMALLLIALTGMVGWWIGVRWCLLHGVTDRSSALSLGAVVPTAGLILSVHLPAGVALFSEDVKVNSQVVAPVFAVLTLMGGVFAWSRHRDRKSDVLDRVGVPRWRVEVQRALPRGWRTAVVLVAGCFAVFLLDAATRFPSGYDGLNYHLPVAARWMQQQRLDLTAGLLHQSLPGNAMVVPFLLLFARLERLLAAVFVPQALLLGLTVYALTMRLGGGRRAALTGALTALTIPIVLFQAFSSYVDLFGSAAWLASLLALMWASRARVPGDRGKLVALAGLAAGVALGCKTTYLVLVAMLGVVACGVDLLGAGRMPGWRRRAVMSGAVFTLATLTCSGFWFLRGTVQAGNPIYPAALRVGDRTLLAGFNLDDWIADRTPVQKLRRWWNYPWREVQYSGTGEPYSVNNALGAAYATFVVPGLLWAGCGVVRRGWPNRRERWKAACVLLVAGGLLLFFTLCHEVLRYVLPLVVLAVPVGVTMLGHLESAFPRALPRLVCASLAVTAVVATLSPAKALAGRVRDGAWSRCAYYEVPQAIDTLAPGARIVNLGEPQHTYALLGKNLSNDVIHGAHWRLMCDKREATAEALWSHAIDYLYVRAPFPEVLIAKLPMKLVFDDTLSVPRATTPATRVYRVVPKAEWAKVSRGPDGPRPVVTAGMTLIPLSALAIGGPGSERCQ